MLQRFRIKPQSRGSRNFCAEMQLAMPGAHWIRLAAKRRVGKEAPSRFKHSKWHNLLQVVNYLTDFTSPPMLLDGSTTFLALQTS
jgi:hypothetical protein